MGGHNVVAVCLPHGSYGTNAATDVASNMRRSFPSLQFCILVGIGAGVPSSKNDIRLGDVIVSTPSGRYSGVLPYDMIKSLEAGASQLNGYLCPPPQTLMCAISELESDPALSSTPLDNFLCHIQKCKPLKFEYPGTDKDRLFVAEAARSPNQPKIFYGLIASANRLMRCADERDRLGKEHNVLCIELVGAGIMNSFPCLVIRGISDYADSHKNKIWQNYASAAAAAYAKLLLSRLRTMDDLEDSPTVEDQGLLRKRLRSLSTDDYQQSMKRAAS
ncbi:nucleoside phosphorylase domain-containing protein [Aspergillus pseudoustus]|uniref:Nucleoside phosphorylase domain-containing protein n=1 Tax=Aspergillus pseudoustus TaxID=1810923 RepID=A0ABR4KXH0_9EURO